MTEKSIDSKAAEQLARAVGRVAGLTRVERLAGIAYLQATLAQASTQGLIDLLRQKNIFSEAEIQRALANAYDERFKVLSGSQSATPLPNPVVRPS